MHNASMWKRVIARLPVGKLTLPTTPTPLLEPALPPLQPAPYLGFEHWQFIKCLQCAAYTFDSLQPAAACHQAVPRCVSAA